MQSHATHPASAAKIAPKKRAGRQLLPPRSLPCKQPFVRRDLATTATKHSQTG